MNRKQERKAETRQRMLAAAGRGFRSQGFAGIGVDGIAKDADATSGAFYAHFGSKDGAFAAALEAGLDEVIGGLATVQREQGADWVRAFADYYLGRTHRDDLACGCAMATLSPEVVRGGPDLQAAYQAKMSRIVAQAAAGLDGGSVAEREARAWAMLSSLIGGLTMARAVADRAAQDKIADAVRSAAVVAAGPTKVLK